MTRTKTLRLISIHEPWATLMALNLKHVETRDWATSYRGPLAIHASKHGMSLQDTLGTCLQPEFYFALLSYRPFRTAMDRYPSAPAGVPKHAMIEAFPDRGKIVAIVSLVDCRPTEAFDQHHGGVLTAAERCFGNYDPLRFGWLTDFMFRVPEPVPFVSRQGLVDVPRPVHQELQRQWRSAAGRAA